VVLLVVALECSPETWLPLTHTGLLEMGFRRATGRVRHGGV
jgi:hypothetical protein